MPIGAVVFLVVTLLTPFAFAGTPFVQNAPRVCIEDGCMRGSWMRSSHGEQYEAFIGVPFAKPPVGELRFANPKPNDPWTDELDASGRIPRSPCLQQNLFLPERGVEGKEDCLYLNVYRPVKIDPEAPLATLVFIHGGGYLAGYNSPLVLGAEKFMDHSVILVTISYRLGVFGFLSTGDDVVSGNFALKDQRLALRWVNKNIRALGGDPQQVTIMGHSAGGASVHLQMMHLGNEGLFQSAISLSGNALAPWSAPKANPEQLARRQAELLGVDNSTHMSTTELVEALRAIDGDLFVTSYKGFTNGSRYLRIVFGPVVESPSVEDAFLTATPQELWSRGEHLPVPWLTGVVPNDGFVFSAPILRNADCLTEKFEQQKELLLSLFGGAKDSTVFSRLMGRFFGNMSTIGECFTKENIHTLSRLFSEGLFVYPLMLSVRQHGHHTGQTAPIFLYKFNYKGPHSYTSIFTTEDTTDMDMGIVHCDELLYIFRAPILFPDFQRNSPDAKVSRRMTELLVNFARTGRFPGTNETINDDKADFPQALELFNSNSTDHPLKEQYINFYDDDMFAFWTNYFNSAAVME